MSLLRIIVGLLLLVWLLGLLGLFKFAGSLIHAVIIVALILFVIDWMQGRRVV